MGLIKSSYTCTLTLAMDIVGGKWKMVILWHLRNGVLRFNELRRLLEGITQKMLTQQLRELEDSGLIKSYRVSCSPAQGGIYAHR